MTGVRRDARHILPEISDVEFAGLQLRVIEEFDEFGDDVVVQVFGVVVRAVAVRREVEA